MSARDVLGRHPHALEHRAGCGGSWTVVLDQEPWSWVEEADRLRQVTVLCWECGITWRLSATSAATDDPRYDQDDRPLPVPTEHRPRLSASFEGAGAHGLCAAVPPRAVAGLLVHLESRAGWDRDPWDDAVRCLVADREGNVLGSVVRGHGRRGGQVWQAGAVDVAVWRLDAPARTLVAAVKALKAAALPAGAAAGVGRTLEAVPHEGVMSRA